MQAQLIETTVGKDGELVLKGLPFEPGEPVEVLVVSKTSGSATSSAGSLRDSVLEFIDPLGPVGNEEWNALR